MIRSQHENRKPFAPNSLKIPTRQHRCNKATLSQKKPQLIEEVAAQQRKAISDEIAALNEEAARLQREIDELSAAGDATIA